MPSQQPPRTSNTYLTLLEAVRGISDTLTTLATKEDLARLQEEFHSLKETTYSRELMDEKLKAYEVRIKKVEDGWMTMLTRGAAIISVIWAILSIAHLLHP